MTRKRACGRCGAELGGGALEGLCPVCVAQAAFLEEPEAATALAAGLPATRLRYFGDYELLEEIARGGMGVIYKARQLTLNRVVAVKMILAGQLASPADVLRFRAEAETAANLHHPNIVPIHEVGQQDGQHYFSMEYVSGSSLAVLSAELGERGAAWVRRAAGYMRAIAEAIHYAHQNGTLHRDLKPSNILIDEFDQPRITDFGLAKRVKSDSDLTVTGQILGTPNFMSPEQASGRRTEVGPPSDIYSLGAILYYLVTGRAPFQGATTHETLSQVIQTEPGPPRRLNPAIERDLEVICLKCLQKDPARRYTSAQELADDLGRFLEGQPIQARPIGCVEKLWRTAHRHRLVTSLLAALMLALLVVAMLVTPHMGSASPAMRIAAMPKLNAQGVSGVIGGKVYVTTPAAGFANSYPKYLHVYDPKLNTWKQLADSLAHQVDAAAGVINGKLYLAGGSNETNGPCNLLEVYDPQSNIWTFKAAMPTARRNCAGAVLWNKLYIIGGDSEANILRAVESYDPQSDRWAQEPDLLIPRLGCAAVTIDKTLFVIGGQTNRLGQCAGPVETWRPGTKWTFLGTSSGRGLPVPVGHAYVAALNGLVYIFGGSNENGPVDRSQLLTSGPDGRDWDFQQPLPEVRYSGSGAVDLDGKVWLFGGWSKPPNKPFPHADVFVFDPSHDSWQASAADLNRR